MLAKHGSLSGFALEWSEFPQRTEAVATTLYGGGIKPLAVEALGFDPLLAGMLLCISCLEQLQPAGIVPSHDFEAFAAARDKVFIQTERNHL